MKNRETEKTKKRAARKNLSPTKKPNFLRTLNIMVRRGLKPTKRQREYVKTRPP
jgi:hypothetical protein